MGEGACVLKAVRDTGQTVRVMLSSQGTAKGPSLARPWTSPYDIRNSSCPSPRLTTSC